MTEWTSISVTQEQKDQLESMKPDGMTMGTWLVQAIDSNEYSGVDVDTGKIARDIVDAVAVEADGNGRVDSDELANAVVRKVDYAQLANAVADELEVRMK